MVSTLATLPTLALRLVDSCIYIRGLISVLDVKSTLRNINSITIEIGRLLEDIRNLRNNRELLEENNLVDFGVWDMIWEVVWWTVYMTWIGLSMIV